MGCGASRKHLEKVAAPTARGANHSSTVTTHQSDLNLKNKVPETISKRPGEDFQSVANLSGRTNIQKSSQSQSNFSETLDVKAVLSPRSSGTFNVICWCSDAGMLKQIAKDPLLEYVPEGSEQVIIFNRLSALSSPSVEVPKRITAVVYLLTTEDDLPSVREFYRDHSNIWNHIIVASGDMMLPRDLKMLWLKPEDNLMREIHNSYLDLITVIDGFLVTTKSSTFQSISMCVNSEVNELLDVAGGVDLHPRLSSLREFWTKGRLALWKAREKLANMMGRIGTQADFLLSKVQKCLSSAVEESCGSVKLTFGDMGREQCEISARLAIGDMERVVGETAAVIKCKTCECWCALALVPKPESVTIIENSQLSQLAKKTLDSIVSHDPKLKDLFGYDMKFHEGKLYLSFWLSLLHSASKENAALQSFLSALEALRLRQEVRFSYKSALTIDDFHARKTENLCGLLLEKSQIEVNWRLSVPLWELLREFLQPIAPELVNFAQSVTTTFAETRVDVQMENGHAIGRSLISPMPASTFFDFLRTRIREPLECSPPLMQQLQNSLEFYLPSLSIVGRVQSLGFELKGSLPKLSTLLSYDKTFPFLCTQVK